MDKDQLKILLPMIRKVTPALIAQDIVGVQPMITDTAIETGETYVDEAASYATEANTVEWYWARLPVDIGAIFNMVSHQQHINNVDNWCRDTFGPPMTTGVDFVWDKINNRYCFKRAEDRTAFVLKWS